MVCNSCGRDNQNENSNFCEYCGASLREGVRPEVEPTTNYSYQNGTGYASAPVTAAHRLRQSRLTTVKNRFPY